MTMKERIHNCPLNHGLELKEYKKQYLCDGCKEQGHGPRYRCEPCNYDLHKECMFTSDTASHDFFKRCKFKFYDVPPKKCCDKHCKCERYCDACGKVVKGFVYHCKEKGWDLHPCCKNLQNKVDLGGIRFRLREKVLSKCIWCNHKNPKGSVSGIRGWSYVSECKDYHFHVYCGIAKVLDELQGRANGDGNHLALENLELPLQNSRRNGGTGGRYWKVVRIVFKTIACILLGDPTITFASLVVELVRT